MHLEGNLNVAVLMDRGALAWPQPQLERAPMDLPLVSETSESFTAAETHWPLAEHWIGSPSYEDLIRWVGDTL